LTGVAEIKKLPALVLAGSCWEWLEEAESLPEARPQIQYTRQILKVV
jgi:hypothetical protein